MSSRVIYGLCHKLLLGNFQLCGNLLIIHLFALHVAKVVHCGQPGNFFSHSFRDFRSFFYFVCFLDKFIALLLLQVLVHFRCISADSFDLNSDETELLSVPKT